jgi:hypothetical protein
MTCCRAESHSGWSAAVLHPRALGVLARGLFSFGRNGQLACCARTASGHAEEQFADISGFSQQYISGLEAGHRNAPQACPLGASGLGERTPVR